MPKFIITSDPSGGTAETVSYMEDTPSAAESELATKSEELGRELYLWTLHASSELDIEVTVVPE